MVRPYPLFPVSGRTTKKIFLFAASLRQRATLKRKERKADKKGAHDRVSCKRYKIRNKAQKNPILLDKFVSGYISYVEFEM